MTNEYHSKKLLDFAATNAEEMSLVSSIVFVQMAETDCIDEVTIAEHTALFLDWLEDTSYAVNAIRKRGDDLYKCIQAHKSQRGWEPENVPALWKHIGDPAVEYPDWSAPHGAHDAYDLGAKVTHNGKRWISDMNGNAYEPGVAAWTEVT